MVYFLSVAGVLVLVLGGVLWAKQRVLLYHPDPTRVSPATVGLKAVREVVLETGDGVKLIAWSGRARPGQPTLLYFHGNASNLAGRAGRVGEYLAKGRGVLMLSYRGYGGSEGQPTEANNFADARLAYDWLRAQGVAAEDIILYGESLGSGVAVKLATEVSVGGIILDAPYTSIADVGQRVYPYLPVRTFLFDWYDSLSRISGIAAPLLIVHGAKDDLIPIEMGRALYRAAPEPKSFAAIAGGGHNDHYLFGSYDVIHEWIDARWPAASRQGRVRGPASGASPSPSRVD